MLPDVLLLRGKILTETLAVEQRQRWMDAAKYNGKKNPVRNLLFDYKKNYTYSCFTLVFET